MLKCPKADRSFQCPADRAPRGAAGWAETATALSSLGLVAEARQGRVRQDESGPG